jgi:hypothetical protein
MNRTMNTRQIAHASIKAELEWLERALEGCTDGGIRNAIESRITSAKQKLAADCSGPLSPTGSSHSRRDSA